MTTTYDAIEAPTPVPTADTRDLSAVTPELRALLTAYSRAVDEVNNSPIISWFKPISTKLPRRLKLPVLRYFASTILVRHLYRCVDALRCGIGRCNVVSGNADEHSGN